MSWTKNMIELNNIKMDFNIRRNKNRKNERSWTYDEGKNIWP